MTPNARALLALYLNDYLNIPDQISKERFNQLIFKRLDVCPS